MSGKPMVDCVLDARAATGEGAIWSVAEQVLYWVDIPAGELHRFDPATGADRVWTLGRPIGCFALRAEGGAMLALSDGFHAFDLADGAPEAVFHPEPHRPGNRFNDGTVDVRGRFYAGTMPMAGPDLDVGPEGTLYRLDPDRSVAPVSSGYYVINGLAFSPDYRTAYVSDTVPSVRTIWAYDYDADTARWENKRVFFDTRAVAGRPDGGAMDADGCYWMAGVGGWELVRISPDGRVDLRIEMPVEKPTRIAFGGRALDVLYVTSISAGITAGTAGRQPHAGGVFALTVPGVTGVEMPLCAA